MSEPKLAESPPDAPSREEMTSALFAQLVMQQANMAMMLLGKIAHPESGQVIKDIEAARLFIDQLEMLEVKTKGNLTKEEAALLKQGLMSSRLAFVQAMDSPQPQAGAKLAEPAPPPPSAPAVDPGQAAPADDDHRKKFSKKY